MKNAKNTIIVLVVIALAVAVFTRTKPAQNLADKWGKVGLALEAVKKIEEYAAYNTYEIDMLHRRLDESEKKNAELLKVVESQGAVIAEINGKLSALPSFEIPDISDTHPQDYEECLQELQGSRQAGEKLIEIVGIQQDRIGLLEAKISAQDIMIAKQAEVIKIQRADLQAYHDTYEAIVRDANRRKTFGYIVGVLGVAAAIIL